MAVFLAWLPGHVEVIPDYLLPSDLSPLIKPFAWTKRTNKTYIQSAMIDKKHFQFSYIECYMKY